MNNNYRRKTEFNYVGNLQNMPIRYDNDSSSADSSLDSDFDIRLDEEFNKMIKEFKVKKAAINNVQPPYVAEQSRRSTTTTSLKHNEAVNDFADIGDCKEEQENLSIDDDVFSVQSTGNKSFLHDESERENFSHKCTSKTLVTDYGNAKVEQQKDMETNSTFVRDECSSSLLQSTVRKSVDHHECVLDNTNESQWTDIDSDMNENDDTANINSF